MRDILMRYYCILVPVYQLTLEKSEFLQRVLSVLQPQHFILHFDGPSGYYDALCFSQSCQNTASTEIHLLHSDNQQLGEDGSRYQMLEYMRTQQLLATAPSTAIGLTLDDDGENSIEDAEQIFQCLTTSSVELCFGNYSKVWKALNFRNIASYVYHRQFRTFGITSAPTFCGFRVAVLERCYSKPRVRWQCTLLMEARTATEIHCRLQDLTTSTYSFFKLITIFFENPFRILSKKQQKRPKLFRVLFETTPINNRQTL